MIFKAYCFYNKMFSSLPAYCNVKKQLIFLQKSVNFCVSPI